MKRNTFLYLALAGGLIFIIWYSLNDSSSSASEPLSPNGIKTRIQNARQQKDEMFKKSEDSPLKEEQKATFQGLNYYPVQTKYRVEASLEFINPTEDILLRMSRGKEEVYQRYAWANFQLQGKEIRALLLRKARNSPQLFLIFSDQSSGEETYGGGRYIDIPFTKRQNKVWIDFNKAYNPYCVYNPDYACPLPLSENDLDLAIEAGEKNFAK